ncbi:AraC family transcriptional regulator [Bradyrhizobium sp. Tv2a-2]|uniref:AraC family transcriptional regulator n=1 Tax=Bradyrhizobium sp. Tv2a-2 TaxID=113395 RepID=UPI00068736B6|nr:AraC family transcriptional regulator [Bradyrhizobium sp. Tv2a-2]
MMAGKAMPPDTGRLKGFGRVATPNVDEAAEQIGRIFCPHDLEPLRATSPGFFARHNCAPFDGFSINYVAYGGSVVIDPGCLERFFLVQIPLSGSARVRTAARDIGRTPDVAASLLSPTVPTEMLWQNDCAQLILLVERKLVEQRAAALAGREIQAVEFDPLIDLRLPAGRGLRAQMEGLADLAEGLGAGRPLSAVAAADCREALLDALLLGQRHGLSEAIRTFAGAGETLPWALRRARDCLQAHAAEPLDLAQLAAVAGIGVRALQLGFQRHFGTSISDMLLDIRLSHLNAQLKRAAPGARIIDIAFDLGFTHLGRMAGAYRAKFGETPSATLRRLH